MAKSQKTPEHDVQPALVVTRPKGVSKKDEELAQLIEEYSIFKPEGLIFDPTSNTVRGRFFGSTIERKRFLRTAIYQRFPLFVRPFLFWVYSYIFRLGFLDGLPGLIFHTLQRFWFRFLVDAKLYELKLRKGRHGDSE